MKESIGSPFGFGIDPVCVEAGVARGFRGSGLDA
jgi:hypothetical protein